MSRVSVPASIRRMRFENRQRPEQDLVKSLEYLVDQINGVVISEKNVLDRNLLVLDVKPGADKLKFRMAINGVYNDNDVIKITSLNRKSTVKYFRGRKGHTESNKLMYIRFAKPCDINKLLRSDS